MSYRFVKRQNAIGWDWYLESDDCSSWVSPLAKEVIETLEAENAKLRELVKRYHHLVTGTDELWSWQSVHEQLHELGVEVDG